MQRWCHRLVPVHLTVQHSALQSVAQGPQPCRQGRWLKIHSPRTNPSRSGEPDLEICFPARMPHVLLAGGPENNPEKHWDNDNDTIPWQGLPRARRLTAWMHRGRADEIHPSHGEPFSDDSFLVGGCRLGISSQTPSKMSISIKRCCRLSPSR